MNTALEELADHLNPEEHPRIRRVKDCAAGAVLVAVLGALGVALAFVVQLLRD
jgi:diacylglycerol kinase